MTLSAKATMAHAIISDVVEEAERTANEHAHQLDLLKAALADRDAKIAQLQHVGAAREHDEAPPNGVYRCDGCGSLWSETHALIEASKDFGGCNCIDSPRYVFDHPSYVSLRPVAPATTVASKAPAKPRAPIDACERCGAIEGRGHFTGCEADQ